MIDQSSAIKTNVWYKR